MVKTFCGSQPCNIHSRQLSHISLNWSPNSGLQRPSVGTSCKTARHSVCARALDARLGSGTSDCNARSPIILCSGGLMMEGICI